MKAIHNMTRFETKVFAIFAMVLMPLRHRNHTGAFRGSFIFIDVSFSLVENSCFLCVIDMKMNAIHNWNLSLLRGRYDVL